MATRALTASRRQNNLGAKDVIVTWNGLANGDDGAWFSEPGMVMRSYSISGTFGAGGSAAIKVTGGNAIDSAAPIVGTQADESIMTGAGALVAAQTVTNGQYTAAPSYRPVVTAGDGTTSLKVVLYFIAD